MAYPMVAVECAARAPKRFAALDAASVEEDELAENVGPAKGKPILPVLLGTSTDEMLSKFHFGQDCRTPGERAHNRRTVTANASSRNVAPSKIEG